MLNKLIEILISFMILVPVFWVLYRVRFRNVRNTMLYCVFAVYLSAVYLFVGMPTLQFLRLDISLTLIPFLPMVEDLKNTLLNVLLFVPLGMMLPFLWKRYSTLADTVIFGVCMTLSIEFLQIFTYRATDVNDVIANTLGTVLGYYIFRGMLHIVPSAGKVAEKKNEVSVIIPAVLITMFFVQPYLAALYYRIA